MSVLSTFTFISPLFLISEISLIKHSRSGGRILPGLQVASRPNNDSTSRRMSYSSSDKRNNTDGDGDSGYDERQKEKVNMSFTTRYS